MSKSKNTAAAAAPTTGQKVSKVSKAAKGGQQKPAKAAKGGKAAPKGGQQAAAKPAKAAKAPKGGQQRGRASEFPMELKVKAVSGVELREGSFAAKVSALAAKPITLGDLIEACVSKRADFFRSSEAAKNADSARRALTVRIRDLIRAEYLQAA